VEKPFQKTNILKTFEFMEVDSLFQPVRRVYFQVWDRVLACAHQKMHDGAQTLSSSGSSSSTGIDRRQDMFRTSPMSSHMKGAVVLDQAKPPGESEEDEPLCYNVFEELGSVTLISLNVMFSKEKQDGGTIPFAFDIFNDPLYYLVPFQINTRKGISIYKATDQHQKSEFVNYIAFAKASQKYHSEIDEMFGDKGNLLILLF
jgi:hypothetical protein